MFRNTKSDDQLEQGEPEGKGAPEDADRGPSSEKAGRSVASSALRWLGAPRKAEESTGNALESDDESDDLELTEIVSDAADGDASRIESSNGTGADTINADRALSFDGKGSPFLEFDDEDDIADFDDLGDIDGVTAPPPAEKHTLLSDIDIDETSSPDDLDEMLPGFVDVGEDQTGSPESSEIQLMPEELETGEEEAPLAPADLDKVELELTNPLIEPNGEELRKEEPETQPTETSLALQPIPELQTAPRPPRKASPGSEFAARRRNEIGDSFVEIFDGDGDKPATADAPSSVLASSEDDDLDDSLDGVDLHEIDPLGIEGLEMDDPDHAGDHIESDWHAHLADVLGGVDSKLDEPLEVREINPSERPDSSSSSVLPLSKTLAQLAVTNLPENEGVDPAPPVSRKAAHRKLSAGEQPAALSAETGSLSQEQLSLGIIANVPRLRRFAAAQIGDEESADRLVQTTIEAALADPSALEPACDLGLALMMLLYQHRQEVLDDPMAPVGTPETARVFETALCRGLAGADQFEIHEFARAINGLEERDRELLILVALENLGYDQIARMLQVPAARIMARISSARIRLRQALSADDPETNGAAPSVISSLHSQEIDIHGYLDGELDGHHMADVDTLVEHDEDAADRLLHYGIQGDLVRRLYAPLLNRPIPRSMLDALLTAAKPVRRGFRFGPRRALIAGAILLGLSVGVSWPYGAKALGGAILEAMTMSSSTVAAKAGR